MTTEEKITLIKYRREATQDNFTAAKIMIDQNKFKIALRDLYYSAFQLTLALFLTKGIIVKTHSSVIQLFGKYFIQTGEFDPKFGRLINKLMDYRHKADYADYMSITKDKVKNLFNETQEFIETANNYLDDWLKQNAEK